MPGKFYPCHTRKKHVQTLTYVFGISKVMGLIHVHQVMILTFQQDIWNSRRSLSKIEGFDHAVVNTTLGACGDLLAPKEGPCLPFFTWQCGEIKVIKNN